jgi:toxin HigB-1
MIASFRHTGLKRLYDTGNAKGVRADQVKRIRRILGILDAATGPEAFAPFPNLGLHPLKGELAGFWSVSVSGNWRIVFRFEGEDAADVDLVDYH